MTIPTALRFEEGDSISGATSFATGGSTSVLMRSVNDGLGNFGSVTQGYIGIYFQ